MKTNVFQRHVLDYYRKHGRALPWRDISSLPPRERAYRVLVSEVMLQQTQAGRVIPKYLAFLKRFPTVASLANAEFRDILFLWQGLGYNRRARMLHRAAQRVVEKHRGKLPKDEKELLALPCIGPYTAGAIRVFAYDTAAVIIETNIRSVFIHFFFPGSSKVKDADIIPYIEKTLDRKNVARWYSALMDYGSMLKKRGENPSKRSSHYKKQSSFKNSDREIRGAIIRTLVQKEHSLPALVKHLNLYERERVERQVQALAREEIITVKRRIASVA